MVCSLPGSSVRGILQAGLWSGLPCPLPGDLPDPGLEPTSLTSPLLAGWFFFFFLPLAAPGKPYDHPYLQINKLKQKVRNFIHDNVVVLVLQLRNCVPCCYVQGISGSRSPLSRSWTRILLDSGRKGLDSNIPSIFCNFCGLLPEEQVRWLSEFHSACQHIW